MILPAEIRLGADKRGKGRQEGKKEGGEEGARQGREARVPNCEVSHTWRREGGGARSWLPLMMMVTQWRRVKMDGRFISNRLIQTGSIGGKPDRTAEAGLKGHSPSRSGVSLDRGEFLNSVCCLVGG